MKKYKLLSSFIIAACIIMAGASCKKGYLDVNTDPNNPTVNTVSIVLPTAQGYLAYDMGSPFQILGGFWSQYWTQGPTGNQYAGYDQYLVTSTDFNTQWVDLYAGSLNDLRYIVAEGSRLGRNNYVAIAKILQAFEFQVLTDLHGDIPFKDALKGSESVITPVFDPQQEVYDGIITLVDEGLALIDVSSADHPGGDDLIFGGHMDQWRKFGNTLKLRIYLRQAYVRPDVAEAGIKAMYNAGADFIDQGDEAAVQFFDVTFNQHPLFASIKALGEQNILGSETAINFMQGLNDPRIDVFYLAATAAPNTGQQVGILQGDGRNLDPGGLSAEQFSKPGPAVGGPGGPTAPVIFISEAESYFLQSEAVARGWGTGNAQQLYEDAITLSFFRWGFAGEDAAAYIAQEDVAYPAAGTMEDAIKAIITQKWVSMCGTENVEAWTEWRRAGYPAIFTISATSNIGDKFPVRILYPDSEKDTNPNTPPQKAVTDKVWWDVNTTGQN